MAQFNYRFGTSSQGRDKSQPRPLTRSNPAQPCSWTNCATKAVSEHKGKVYCASHLLRTLQQQWQE